MLVLAVALVGAAVYFIAQRPRAEVAPNEAPEVAARVETVADGRLVSSGSAMAAPLGRLVICYDDASFWLKDTTEAHSSGSELTYNVREQVPGTTDQEFASWAFSTSFTVTATATRQSNEVYVAGKSSGHDTVIERWVMGEPKGSHFFHVIPASTPIGTPAPPQPGTASGIVDGTYIPTANRPKNIRQIRTELFRGNLGTGISAMTADPEGRYLLFIANSPREIYQLSLAAGATPTLLYTEAQIPELNKINGLSGRMHHATLGRVYMFGISSADTTGTTHVVLNDVENDGVIDTWQVLTPALKAQQGFNGPVWVRDNFSDYITP